MDTNNFVALDFETATARSAWFGFSGKENENWDAQGSTSHWLRGERYQDFGARYYDPVSCCWTGQDPLAESYYYISPYAYCGGDPMNYVDYNGDVRQLVINQQKKTIVVKAKYYYTIGATERVIAAIKLYNSLKGLSYTDPSGNEYAVSFQLTSERVSNPQHEASRDHLSNYIILTKDLPKNTSGETSNSKNNRYIRVSVKEENSMFNLAHEIGHTLGAALTIDGKDNHAEEGLMVKYVTSKKRGYYLDQKSVNEIIEMGKGPTQYSNNK